MRSATLTALRQAREQGRGVALVTHLDSGVQALVFADQDLSRNGELIQDGGLIQGGEGALEIPSLLLQPVLAALRRESSCCVEQGDQRFFVHVFHPPLRLVIVGAVHIAQPLVSIAAQAGYAVTLVDPRSAWATPERFPEVAIVRRWPQEALDDLSPDRRTAIVTLVHDPKLDDPALVAALASEAFYVGALGSRRTQARRLERLRELGVAEEALSRIHGPVGLDIGAVSPAEIAISIMAEITRVLSGLRRVRS